MLYNFPSNNNLIESTFITHPLKKIKKLNKQILLESMIKFKHFEGKIMKL